MFEKFDNNTLVICSNETKTKFLKENKRLYKCSFITMNEFIKRVMFDYDDQAVLFLIKEYGYSYEIAKEYLDNIYYALDSNDINDKIIHLKKLKKVLDDHNLLIYDDEFVKFAHIKKIIIYNLNISKFEKHILDSFNIEIINDKNEDNVPTIYEFNSLNEEVCFICDSICKLIETGVDISKIKLTNVDNDYLETLEKYCYLYNLKISKHYQNRLDSLIIGKTFLDNLDNLDNAIKSIEKYQSSDVYNQIINICNKFVWASDDDKKILIEQEMHNTYSKNDKYSNEIEVVDYLNYPFCDEYVFMVGFNEGVIPTLYKDEDYLTDKDKPHYLDTTLEKNIAMKNRVVKTIKNIKNLVVTYKLKDDFGVFYPSNLLDELNTEIIREEIKYDDVFSVINARLNLASKIDEYVKYNFIDKDLGLLKSNFSVPYNVYSHEYKLINKKLIQDYISSLDKFILSYSSLDNYNRCNFRFFLENVLRIGDYETKFSVILGNIYHHILEIGLKNDIDIKKEVYEYVDDNNIELSKADKFFLEKAIDNMDFLIRAIKKQNTTCRLNNLETEKRIEINLKDNIFFKGFIDKIIYDEVFGKTIAAIIDYKTYVKKPTLRYLDYGIAMQLPVYMYLAKKTYENVEFAGVYMQNILLDNKSDEDKMKSLKLIGLSNLDSSVLEYLDCEYENSEVIAGLKVNKDGNFSASSLKNMVSSNQMDNIINTTEKQINNAVDNILNAKFKINPKYNHGNIGCEFCPYADICFKKDYDYEFLNIEEGEEDD